MASNSPNSNRKSIPNSPFSSPFGSRKSLESPSSNIKSLGQDIYIPLDNLRNKELYSKLDEYIQKDIPLEEVEEKKIDLEPIYELKSKFDNDGCCFFLGNDFDWFINILKMEKYKKVMNIPYYLYSTSKSRKLFGSRRSMIDVMYDYIFMTNSRYYIIYISNNTDINIMTIAYYILSNIGGSNCVLIIEKSNKNVFRQINYELDQLRKLLILTAKKQKKKIFYSKQDFINSFINPLTNEFNVDLFKKLANDMRDNMEEITGKLIDERFKKLNSSSSTTKFNNLRINMNFLKYPSPVDYDEYHKYSILTKHMKEKLSMDNTFNIIRDEFLLRIYYLGKNLYDKDIDSGNDINSGKKMTKDEKRIKKKFEYIYEEYPSIRLLDTKENFESGGISYFTKFLFNKKKLSNKQMIDYYKYSDSNPIRFVYKYLNPQNELHKKMMTYIRDILIKNKNMVIGINDLNEIEITKIFQKVIVSHLFNEINESRYFLKNILYIQSCYNIFSSKKELGPENIFICILSCFDDLIFNIEHKKKYYQINFYKNTPFFDTNTNIYHSQDKKEYKKTEIEKYRFKSNKPDIWLYELMNLYYIQHSRLYT